MGAIRNMMDEEKEFIVCTRSVPVYSWAIFLRRSGADVPPGKVVIFLVFPKSAKEKVGFFLATRRYCLFVCKGQLSF